MEFSRPVDWSGYPFPSSGGSSQPRDQTQVSRIAGGFFSSWATKGNPYTFPYEAKAYEALALEAKTNDRL